MKIKKLFIPDTLPTWLVVLSFGPYVFPNFGIRTEHLLVYLLLPFGILVLLLAKRSVFYSPSVFFTFILVLTITVITICSTIFGYDFIIENASVGKIISHGEKYLRPLAVIIGLSAFFRISEKGEPRNALINISKALLYMLAINSILVATQLFVDIAPILSRFTYGMGSTSFDVGTTQSVAELGVMMGRFTGIFNQPAEAGLTYTLGLFSWAYLNSIKREGKMNKKEGLLLLGLVFVGGFFSISKLFIILGIPLFTIYLLLINHQSRVLDFKLCVIIIIAILTIGYFLKGSERFSSLYMLIDALNNRSVSGLTGGRFGDPESGVIERFKYVWEHNPLFGLGFAAYTCIDNGYLEFFAQGGLACLIGYVILLMSMALIALKHLNTAEGRLLMFIVVFVVGAAIGMPPLTANRFSPIVWVFIILIYFIFYSDKNVQRREKVLS